MAPVGCYDILATNSNNDIIAYLGLSKKNYPVCNVACTVYNSSSSKNHYFEYVLMVVKKNAYNYTPILEQFLADC